MSNVVNGTEKLRQIYPMIRAGRKEARFEQRKKGPLAGDWRGCNPMAEGTADRKKMRSETRQNRTTTSGRSRGKRNCMPIPPLIGIIGPLVEYSYSFVHLKLD